jgi:hypothetical protein
MSDIIVVTLELEAASVDITTERQKSGEKFNTPTAPVENF